ncbi:MAG: class I SAM-dependent methyltransferase, partial [Chitinophagales bacterium]|nr:class I SAM-dependent methyltransferase [Chitinophagales bacterium]
GVDAIHLAQNNRVTATDASEAMLRITKAKIDQNDLQSNCKTILWNLNDQFPGDKEEKYDLIFSNFGGLNCISPEALKNLSLELRDLLKPGGEMIFVVMGRFCLMESLYFLFKGKWKSVFRRRSKKSIIAALNKGAEVEIWYYSSNKIIQLFNQFFVPKGKYPVGIFIPPSYFESFIKKHPTIYDSFVIADKLLRGIGFLSCLSDHYIVELKNKAE